jgi:hypothetical protein
VPYRLCAGTLTEAGEAFGPLEGEKTVLGKTADATVVAVKV